MADPELIFPKLPKLVPLAAPYRKALFGVSTAMGYYNDLRETYRRSTPPPERRFNIRNLLSGALLKSRRSELKATSGEDLVNVRTDFDTAAKQLDNIEARVKEAQARSRRPDILLNLRAIGSSLASARKLIADGQARFDAYGIRPQDHDSDVSVQNSLAVSEHRKLGIQPDGRAAPRPSRRANREVGQSSSPTPQQRKDPLEAHYGYRLPPREPLPPMPQPTRERKLSR